MEEYTKDALKFFEDNKHLGKEVILKDGSAGIKIKIKLTDETGKTKFNGGYWTKDGKIVTYFD
ncbi:MAG: hypothetical protein J0H68_05835 [Sphingobacteriia bacterium]|nr:hypothetical protein [Sphingobacteriia bacterium]